MQLPFVFFFAIFMLYYFNDDCYKMIAFCVWCVCAMIYGVVYVIKRKDIKDEPLINIQTKYGNRE